ncbi:menaquinone biosynthesis protein [Paenibacillus sp. JSM ZJ436]|uniref:menaquinone biosynthesis protein n=1 Tax=Paenibacillus sp. JSM ZJ436 TaxID=3376190 RepID=UPI0037ABF547
MSRPDGKTVIGKISYTNAWPLFHYADPGRLPFPAELLTAVPAVLNQGMQQGSIHIGALSSFAYGQAADKLLLLPDLSVSSDGDVKSILLFSQKPLSQLVHSRIALTNTSATSVNLLKILLKKSLNGSPEFMTMEPDLDLMMASADGALLIGDHAIKASWSNHKYHVTDLGRWWKEYTGCSMTYAVWAVNRAAVQQSPGRMKAIMEMFQASKLKGLSELQPIIDEARVMIGGSQEYWQTYFSNLEYDLDDGKQQGLQLYFKYAHELGLLSSRVYPEIWNDKFVVQVKE